MRRSADTRFPIGQTHYAGRDLGDNMTDFISNPQTHTEGFFFSVMNMLSVGLHAAIKPYQMCLISV